MKDSTAITGFKQSLDLSIRRRACELKVQAIKEKKTNLSSALSKMMTANLMLKSLFYSNIK